MYKLFIRSDFRRAFALQRNLAGIEAHEVHDAVEQDLKELVQLVFRQIQVPEKVVLYELCQRIVDERSYSLLKELISTV